MSSAAWLTLVITLFAAALLVSERLRPDLIGLLVLATLGATSLVAPEELFTGFSSAAIITILAISIISEGLRQSGVTYRLGAILHRYSGHGEARMILAVMLVSAALSLFMNNIAAVGVLLPAVMNLTRRSQVPPSRLLMPLAFGTILGGMATLLTTSNIIVSGALRDSGVRPFGLLDFLPVGGPIVFAGAVYMVAIGRRFLPSRYPAGQAIRTRPLSIELAGLYGIEKHLAEIEVLAGSPLANKSLIQGEWATRIGANVVGISRGDNHRVAPPGSEIVRVGDVILAQGSLNQGAVANAGLKILSQTDHHQHEITSENVILAEVLVSPHTPLIGKSLRNVKFRERYGLNVLAVWRGGASIQTALADLPLQFGDTLLVQGTPARLQLLQNEHDFLVLEEDPDAILRPRKSHVAIVITLITLGIAASGLFNVPTVVMIGAVLMILAGCLSMNDAYRAIEWKAIFVIAGMWPLTIAIRTTGLADAAIQGLYTWLGSFYPLGLAAVLLIVAMLFTQLMSGQIAALVLAPLAISAAFYTGADPRALGMAVALGCSLAFLTPYGHPVNIMVMASGGYTMRDFVRVGGPLTAIVLAMILLGLWGFWGL